MKGRIRIRIKVKNRIWIRIRIRRCESATLFKVFSNRYSKSKFKNVKQTAVNVLSYKSTAIEAKLGWENFYFKRLRCYFWKECKMASLATCLTIIAVLRIRDPGPFFIPGSRIGKYRLSRSGSLNSLIRIGIERNRIRGKHPGSATLKKSKWFLTWRGRSVQCNAGRWRCEANWKRKHRLLFMIVTGYMLRVKNAIFSNNSKISETGCGAAMYQLRIQ
jgi:hypothetical protein